MAAPVHVEDVNLLGLDTKTSPFLINQGTLLQAQNVVMPLKGRWQKRFGTSLMPQAPQSSLNWTSTLNDELLISGQVSGVETQSSWSPIANAWEQKGQLPKLSIDIEEKVTNSSNLVGADVAIANGFECYTYTAILNGQQFASFAVFDSNSGTLVFSDQPTSGIQSYDSRVVAIGPYFVILFRIGEVGGSNFGLACYVVNPFQKTVGPVVGLNTSLTAVTAYDARAVSGATVGNNGQYVSVLYAAGVNVSNIGFNPWTNSICVADHAIVELGSNLAPATFCGITVFPTQLCFYATCGQGALNAFFTNLEGADSGTLITVDGGAPTTTPIGKASLQPTNTGWMCVYEYTGNQDSTTNRLTVSPSLYFAAGNFSSRTSGPTSIYRNASLAGDAFLPSLTGQQFFVPINYLGNIGPSALYRPQQSLQQTYLLLEGNISTQTAFAGARFGQDTGAGPTIWQRCPQVNQTSSGPVWACGTQTQSTAVFDGQLDVFNNVAKASGNFSTQRFSADLGPMLHATGGFLGGYDGNQFVEHNFHVEPEPPLGWLCNIACARSVLGLAGSGGAATAEVNNIYFPADAQNPNGSIFGSGWQIKPSSYIIIPHQSTPGTISSAATYTWYPTPGQTYGILFTAVAAGTGGNNIDLVFASTILTSTQIHVVPGTPTPSDTQIIVLLPGTTGDSLQNIVSAINNTPAAAALVTASIVGNINAWDSTPAFLNAFLTGGVNTAGGTATFGPGGYIYFVVDGVGQDPQPFGGALTTTGATSCSILSTDTAQQVAEKFYVAVNGGSSGLIVTASPPTAGTPPTNLNSQQTYLVALTCILGSTSSGVGSPAVYSETFSGDYLSAGISQLTCPAGYRINPGGYFVLPTGSGIRAAFYYTVNGQGAAPNPTAVVAVAPVAGSGLSVPVFKIAVLSYQTPAQVALATLTAIQAAYPSVTLVQTGCTINISNTSSNFTAYNVNVCGSAIDGQYQEAAVWEWFDLSGQLHQSAPSLPVIFMIQGSFTTIGPDGKLYSASGALVTQNSNGGMLLNGVAIGGNGPIFSLPSLWATQKTGVSAAFYRSTASSGGTTLFRTTATAQLLNPTNPNSTTNDYFTNTVEPPDTIGYLETSPDSLINSNPTLYTVGGVLDNGPIPSCDFVTVHRQRLWTHSTEFPFRWFYSQPWSSTAFLGVEFSPGDLFLDLPATAGDGIGAITVDDKLVFFHANGLFYIAGDGPTETGQGDFSPPQQIMTDVGCVAAGSLVQVPEGVWFQSSKGMYFLDRNMQVSFRGAPVKALTTGFTCNSGILMPDRNEIRFFMSANSNQATPVSDYTLCYNYLYDVWSQFTTWAGSSAVIWNDQLTFVDNLGNVKQETTGYLDNGAFTQSLLQTGWLGKSNGLQGWLRVDKAASLGVFGSSHNVQIGVSFNYESSTVYPTTYQASQIVNQQTYAATNVLPAFGAQTPYGITDGSAWNFKVFIPPSPRGGRIESISFTISDTQDQLPGSGFGIDALSLEIQAFGKLNRFGVSRSVG